MSGVTLNLALPERYTPVRHIANGGMAGVWAAHDGVLGREVAIKLLAEQFLSDVAAKARFEREARAAASLSSHPNVVTIYDVAEHEGRPMIVMELFKDGTVADAMRRGRVAREQALDWLAQAADGLDAAHAQGVVHRDIKPANLLVEGRRLAVADFGIARVAWETSVTQTGEVLGTAAYISPEQAQGHPGGAASDRYALAVVAYELLTGSRPFAGGNFAAQARAHIEETPVPASVREPLLSRPVDDVLERGLAKAESQRWPSATAMVSALSTALGEESAVAAPVDEAERTMVMPAAVPRDRTRAPRATPQGRRPLPGWVVASPIVIALAIAAVIALAGGDDGSPTPGRAQSDAAKQATTPQKQSTTQEPAATPTQASTPEPEPAAQAPAGSASELNQQGYALFQQGRAADAIPLLERAAKDCPVSRTDPCAFALFNLGMALVAAGRPGDAVAVFQQRLENPNQRGTVERALAGAQAQAGGGGESNGDGDRHGKKARRKDARQAQ